MTCVRSVDYNHMRYEGGKCMKFLSKLGSVQKLIIPIVGIGALIVFATMFMYEVTQATVDISHDGEMQTVKTHSSNVAELLDEVGIEVGEHDKLSNRMNDPIQNDMEINIQTATHVIITIDDKEHEFYTTADTLEELFQDEGISFTDRDIVSHDLSQPIEEDLVFVATTADKMTIIDGGEEVTVWSTGESVEELLENNDITLNKHDRVLHGNEEDGEVPITIVRVDKKIKEVEKSIPYKEEEQSDDSLEKGQTKVISEGKEGKLIEKHEITLENGKESDRSVIEETVVEDSENRVVAVGTKEPEVVTLAEESKPKEESSSKSKEESSSKPKEEPKEESKEETQSSEPSGGKTYTMTATAYTANCSGCSGITATGIDLNANPNMKVIAVDPSVIPLGTKVWVEGYGEAIAGDTGGSIKGNRIDIHVPSKSEAHNFGFQTVTVKILD